MLIESLRVVNLPLHTSSSPVVRKMISKKCQPIVGLYVCSQLATLGIQCPRAQLELVRIYGHESQDLWQ